MAPGTLSSRLPDGGSREQLLPGAGQGREPATQVRDPAQGSRCDGEVSLVREGHAATG